MRSARLKLRRENSGSSLPVQIPGLRSAKIKIEKKLRKIELKKNNSAS
jgi:hypothetical protein